MLGDWGIAVTKHNDSSVTPPPYAIRLAQTHSSTHSTTHSPTSHIPKPSVPLRKLREYRHPPPVHVALIHIPKTAGSAIKHKLRTYTAAHPFDHSLFGEPYATLHKAHPHDNEGWWLMSTDGVPVHIESWGHQPASTFSKSFPSDRLFKVATVREPTERFFSAYNFVREGGVNHPDQKAVGQARQWQPFLQQFGTFEDFFEDKEAVRTIRQPGSKGHTHFREFGYWVNTANTTSALSGKTGTSAIPATLDVDFIIRQDHLYEDLSALATLLRLPTAFVGKEVSQYNVTGTKSSLPLRVRRQVDAFLKPDKDLYTSITSSRTLKTMHQAATTKLDRLFEDAQTLHIALNPNVSSHFWHMMMGEYFPVLDTVLDEAMRWKRLPKRVMLYADRQRLASLESRRSHRCWDWSNGTVGQQERLRRVAEVLKRWASSKASTSKASPPHTTPLHIVVQTRIAHPTLTTFYQNNAPTPNRLATYGKDRRSVDNLDDVVDALKNTLTPTPTVTLVHDDAKPLRTQIQSYLHADVLVLGHGAGMVHTMWLKPGALVVEIIPRKKHADTTHGAVHGCRRLSEVFGFRLEQIVVDGAHSMVDVAKVVEVVEAVDKAVKRAMKRDSPRKSSTKRFPSRSSKRNVGPIGHSSSSSRSPCSHLSHFSHRSNSECASFFQLLSPMPRTSTRSTRSTRSRRSRTASRARRTRTSSARRRRSTTTTKRTTTRRHRGGGVPGCAVVPTTVNPTCPEMPEFPYAKPCGGLPLDKAFMNAGCSK